MIKHSDELARCTAEGYRSLSTMAKISQCAHGRLATIRTRWSNSSLLQAPEVQQMYGLNIPVSQLRTKVRQEFERHRYVNKLPVVDMLLVRNNAEFQVGYGHFPRETLGSGGYGASQESMRSMSTAERLTDRTTQETLNYWKQIPHVMKYFREQENPTARLPENFMQSFLEVSPKFRRKQSYGLTVPPGAQLICSVLGLHFVHRTYLSCSTYA